MPFTLCLPMSTAPPRHGPPAPMCPHGWLPSPHLLSPPALSGYLAQANTCRAYPGLPTYATTRPGLDPAPNRACAHHGPTRAAVHLPQRTLLCSDKPSQDGSGCPKGMSTTLQHGMAGHHSSISPLFAPIVQCTPWYPQVYSRPYHRGAISTVRPGQGGTTRGRGHTAARGALNKPLDHTVPQQAPRGRTPTQRARRRWGGSTPTTLLLSVWGCEWGSNPLGSYPQPQTNQVGEDASSISRTGRRAGWLWNLRPVNWWSNPKRPKEPDGNAPGRLAESPPDPRPNTSQVTEGGEPKTHGSSAHKCTKPVGLAHGCTQRLG